MKILAFLFQIFPTILQGILAVEQAAKGVPGENKKQIVLSAVDAAAKTGETIPQGTVQAVSTLIDSTVSALNASGLLGKSASVPQPNQSTTAILD